MALVDKRIVEMVFKNKDFEKNAKQSMDTIDKLKESTQFDQNTASLDKIAESVQKLQERFSGLGIVGKRVLENITDSVMHLSGKMTSFLSSSVISGGISRAMNLENSRFMMQNLFKDEQKVTDAMANVSASVDGTAYSLDQAALVATQFTAAGVEIGDELEKSLKGLAGTAATFNTDYAGLGNVFSDVASSGRVMGDTLLQLSTRGIPAQQVLADFFNQVLSGDEAAKDVPEEIQTMVKSAVDGFDKIQDKSHVTAGEIKELASTGAINFQMFSEAMYTTFGENAAKANETFTGALSNIKSALARIGAGFVEPLVIQNGPLVSMFNAIREKTNEVKKGLVFDKEVGNTEALSKRVTDFVIKRVDQLTEKIKTLDISKILTAFYNGIDGVVNLLKLAGDILRPIKESFREIFPKKSIDDVVTLSERFKNFTAGLKVSEQVLSNVKDISKGLFAAIDAGKTILMGIVTSVGPLVLNVLRSIFGWLGNVAAAFGRFLQQVRDFVNALRDSLKSPTDEITGLPKKISSAFKDNALFEGVLTILTKFRDGIQGILDSFKRVRTDGTKKVAGDIKNDFSVLDAILSGVKKFANALYKVLGTIKTILAPAIKWVRNAVGSVFNEFQIIAAKIDNDHTKSLILSGGLAYILKQIGNAINNIGRGLGSGGGISSALSDTLKNISSAITTFKGYVNAKTLKLIADSILELVAAIFILALIPEEDASRGLLSILAIVGILQLLVKKIQSMNEGFGSSLSTAILGVAIAELTASILAIVAALILISFVSYDSIVKGIMTISMIIFVITQGIKSIMKTVDKYGLFDAISTVAVLSVVTASLVAMVMSIAVLAVINKLLGPKNIAAALITLAGMATLLAYSVRVLASAVDDMGVGTVLKMVISITLITAALISMATVMSLLTIIIGLVPNSILKKGLLGLLNIILATVLLCKLLVKSFSDQSIIKTLKVIGTYLVISAALTAMAVSMVAISALIGLIPFGILIAGLAGFAVVILALLMFYIEIVAIGDKLKFNKLIRTIIKLGLVVTVTIALFGSLLLMGAAIGAVIGIIGSFNLLEISSFIVALLGTIFIGALLATKVPKFTKGLDAVVTMIQKLGKAFVYFATASKLLTSAFNQLKGWSEKDVESIKRGFKGAAEAVGEAAPVVVDAIFSLLDSLVFDLMDFLDRNLPMVVLEAIDAVLKSLESVVDQIPRIIALVGFIIEAVIEALRPLLGTLVNEVVLLIIDLINAVANAIKKNQDAILDAIDNLLDSIISLVVQAFGRLFGKNKRDVAKWIEDHKKTLRTFVKWFGITLAGLKIIGVMKKLGSILSVVKAIGSKMAAIKIGAGGMSSVKKLGSEIAEGPLAKIKQFNSYFGGHGILVASISAAAIAGALALKHMVDEMEVVDQQTKDMQKEAEMMKAAYEEAYEKATEQADGFVKGSSEAISSTDEQWQKVDLLKRKLDELVDSDGKVKKGSEELAAAITNELNEALGTNYEIQDGIIKKNGEVVSSYKEVSDAIGKMVTKQRASAALESGKDYYDEAKKFLNDAKNTTRYNDLKYGTTVDDLGQSIKDLETNRLNLFTKSDFENGFIGSISGISVEQFLAGTEIKVKALRDALAAGGQDLEAIDQQIESLIPEGSRKGSNLENFGVDSFFMTSIYDAYKNVSNLISTQKEELGGAQGELEGLEESFSKYTNYVRTYDDLTTASVTGNIELMQQKLQELDWGLQTANNSNAKSLAEQLETNRKAYEADLNLYKKKEAGKTATLMYNSAIRAKRSLIEALKAGVPVLTAVQDLKEYNAAIAYWGEKAEDEAANLDLNLDSDKLASEAGSASEKVADAVTNPFSGTLDKMKGYGDDALDGFGDNADGYTNLGETEFKNYETGIHDEGMFGSPSKKMIQYGKWAVQGFAIGLSDVTDVNRAAYKMVNTLLGSVGAALAAADSMPAITPLVDLSNVQNGSATMQAMLNGNALQAQNLNAKLSTELAAAINGDIHAATEAVVDSIGQLRLDVNSLRRDIRDINVVLNTGALVGQLAGPMDAALGGLSVLKRRGV